MHTSTVRGLLAIAITTCRLLAQDPLAEAGEREVRIVHAPNAPAFAGTLTTPTGSGPHPAVLLVSPAGEHPRDELRKGGRHLADLAKRLAAQGFASLRVDNRGVGGSRNEAWPAWKWSLSLAEQANDVAGHLASPKR